MISRPAVASQMQFYTGFATFQPLTSLVNAISEITSKPKQSYPTHVPLTFIQKGAVALLSLGGAASNPRRADLVAAAGETTGLSALVSIKTRMLETETGRLILSEQPRVTNASVAHAWDLPEGTFGAAYAQFMGSRNFQADERPPVRFIDDPELAYVVARAREVHDFWHVLFNCPTTVFGETALKALEFVQTGMPMTGLAVVAGVGRMKKKDRDRLVKEYLPWAVRAGARSADLMCIYYEKHFDQDLEELRARWRITVAPPI